MPDETPLPQVELDSDEARELADLYSLENDLKFVAGAGDRLARSLAQERRDEIAEPALQTAALIAYARCFGQGKRARLSEADLAVLDPSAVQLHQHLMAMRNKHLAHSVNPFEQVVVTAILASDESAVQGVARFGVKHIAFDRDGAAQLHRYATELFKSVLTPKIQQTHAVVQAQAQLAELRAKPRFIGITIPGPDQADNARPGRPRPKS